MKELEELLAWWGEGISSSSFPSSPPSEDEGWKSNMQILVLSRNMEKEFVEQKFDFIREEKIPFFQPRNLANEFRIISFYSYNNIAITDPSNLFISQKISQPNNVTRRSWNCGYLCSTWDNTLSPRYQYFPCPHSNNTWRPFCSRACSHSAYPSHLAQEFKSI